MNLQPLFNRLYWIVILLLIVLCFIAFNPDHAAPVLGGVTATNLQQVLVLLGLGGLPGVLVWSSRQVKKLKELPSGEHRLARYRTILYVRLCVYALTGIYALSVQFLTQMKGALMFMMVVFVLFAFIWPTKARFETELADQATEEAKEEAVDSPADDDQADLQAQEEQKGPVEQEDQTE